MSTIDREWSLKATPKKVKNEPSSNAELAMDKDGIIKMVNRTRPAEIKGLKLVPLTVELKRLLHFETTFVSYAQQEGYKLLDAYYRYSDYLNEKGIKITDEEFDYIKRRLNKLRLTALPERSFNEGFWFHEKKRLKNPIAEIREGLFAPTENQVKDTSKNILKQTTYTLQDINNQIHWLNC